jgi:hypothetical protein
MTSSIPCLSKICFIVLQTIGIILEILVSKTHQCCTNIYSKTEVDITVRIRVSVNSIVLYHTRQSVGRFFPLVCECDLSHVNDQQPN